MSDDSSVEAAPQTIFALKLQPGKLYRQVVSMAFRVTHAALDMEPGKVGSSKERTSVCLKYDNLEYTMVNLITESHESQVLDMMFGYGESITFYLKGDTPVTLLGNYVPDPEDDLDAMSDIDEESFAAMTDEQKMEFLKQKGLASSDEEEDDDDDTQMASAMQDDEDDASEDEEEEEKEEEPKPKPAHPKGKSEKKASHEAAQPKKGGKQAQKQGPSNGAAGNAQQRNQKRNAGSEGGRKKRRGKY